MQSRKHSIIESISNVALGYVVALGSQLVIYPLFDIHISIAKNMGLTLCFTVLSLLRLYCVRRFFNSRKAVDGKEHQTKLP